MIATTMSCAPRGLAGAVIAVEADIASGLPRFTIVGLCDRAVLEARERVRSALVNAGFDFPQRRVTVNLAPAELPKEGTGFDVAIALAILRSAGRRLRLEGTAAIGELALDATLRPVAGVLPMARCLRGAGVRRLVVPRGNASEAALVDGLEVVAAPTLGALVEHLEGGPPLPPPDAADAPPAPPAAGPDLAEVRGQAAAKRALEIAAAGGHNVLLVGPPGAGKTMLAGAHASLLPDLDQGESLEVAAVYSLRGALRERDAAALRPPFRAPHHSVTRAGLVGGGSGLAQPGEVSLAHRGVLFLDELCEFPRALLEALRQPLEQRSVTIVRARGGVSFPAAFSLLAAANPCPCGFAGDAGQGCRCAPRDIAVYQGRLSGPLRDRIDLVVHVRRQRYEDLFDSPRPEESSGAVRGRVTRARERQRGRAGGDAALNADLRGAALVEACAATAAARRLVRGAGERLQLSARAFHRVLRVARTIADLAGEARVGEAAVAEALRYRADLRSG